MFFTIHIDLPGPAAVLLGLRAGGYMLQGHRDKRWWSWGFGALCRAVHGREERDTK